MCKFAYKSDVALEIMKLILLIIVFHILIVGYVLSISKPQNNFNKCLRLILCLSFLHCTYKLTHHYLISQWLPHEIASPMALLYGPLLYFLYSTSLQKRISASQVLIHCIPFLLLSLLYTRLTYGLPEEMLWNSRRLQINSFHHLILSLSLIFYSIFVGYKMRTEPPADPEKDRLINQLILIEGVWAFMVALLAIASFGVGLQFAFNPLMLLYCTQVMLMAFLSRYLLLQKKELQADHTAFMPSRYAKSSLEEETLNVYEHKLHEHLRNSKIYLKPTLSLELLAKETNIPKHHFSQLLNVHLGKSFYQVIAEYRINHAIDILEKADDQFTIESLAYECGFNSKTSFNRYFKEKTGLTPSDYREVKNTQLMS